MHLQGLVEIRLSLVNYSVVCRTAAFRLCLALRDSTYILFVHADPTTCLATNQEAQPDNLFRQSEMPVGEDWEHETYEDHIRNIKHTRPAKNIAPSPGSPKTSTPTLPLRATLICYLAI